MIQNGNPLDVTDKGGGGVLESRGGGGGVAWATSEIKANNKA